MSPNHIGSSTGLSIKGSSTASIDFVGGGNLGGYLTTDGSTYFAVTAYPSAAGLTFGTNNTTRASIDSSGNVGFGTTSVPSGSQFVINLPASTAGPGTISASASGTTVTGSGTAFIESFQNGDTITAGGETHTITAVASDTSMTTDAWTNAQSGAAYTLASSGQRFLVQQNGRIVIGGGTNNGNGSPRLMTLNRAFLNNGGGNTIAGAGASLSLANTSAAFTGNVIGFQGFPSVAATNTQNWTNGNSLVTTATTALSLECPAQPTCRAHRQQWQKLYVTGSNTAHAGTLDLRSGSVIGSTINMYAISGAQTVKFNTDSVSYINGGNVGIGTTTPSVYGKLTVETTPSSPASYWDSTSAVFSDNRSMATGVGGGIALQGNYLTAGGQAIGAGLQARNTNASSGDATFGLDIWARSG
jgi:hypothetical protein